MKVRGQHGYAMAALLVALSIMAIMMTVAMPAWHQLTQREREAELVFRGQQYARAIGLFQRRSGPGVLPPNLDVLVDQRFLRKKYKDPITGQDFELLRPTSAAATDNSGRGRGTSSLSGSQGTGTVASASSSFVGGAAGGIMGVVSKSNAESIRVFNGRTHYNEWQFVYVAATTAPGANGQGAGAGGGNPNGTGGQGSGLPNNPANPGQRGNPFNGGRGQGQGQGQPGGRGVPSQSPLNPGQTPINGAPPRAR